MNIESRIRQLETAAANIESHSQLTQEQREQRIAELLAKSRLGEMSRERLQELAEIVFISRDRPITLHTPQEREARIAQLLLKARAR